MTNSEQAHKKLLDALNTFIAADQGGESKETIRATIATLHAARDESQKILYPQQQQQQAPQGRRR